VAAYYRLLIPNVLPDEIEKLIYLDADMVINTDIRKLWDMDVGQNYVLAVQEQCKDAQYVSSKKALPSYQDLGIDPAAKYFNSGVMLINLKKWRADNISEKIIEYLQEYSEKVLYWDQDGLNAVLAGKWGELNHRWNLLSQTFTNPCWDDGPIKDRQIYEKLIHDPYIVHFNSPSKPWHVKNKHPYKNLFFHYLSMTKWAGWQPEERR
jgi:lipopolysaccharide biosynthesis glycosyltransferase